MAYELALLALLLGGSGGGAVAYVVTTWLLRALPKDRNVEDLIGAVEKLNRQARVARMREVRAGIDRDGNPSAAEVVAPGASHKAALRARLRARSN